ncbi:MAG TPA: division/cell wall cluster transcriptional repressor MraZ [Pseudomonadales bacterium]|nr:division/cell wall cluster transcriptional repressor MraZ [Pseudomonadales bacterium]
MAFRGIAQISLDPKGRIAIPARFRDQLLACGGAGLVVTIDTQQSCLQLFPLPEWEVLQEKISALPSFNPATRRIQRLLLGHANDVEMDTAGRILLPPLLREYANLEKSKPVILLGQGNRFEIWAEDRWSVERDRWIEEERVQSGMVPDELRGFSI